MLIKLFDFSFEFLIFYKDIINLFYIMKKYTNGFIRGFQAFLRVLRQLADFLSSSADSSMVEMIKALKRTDHFLLAESETGGWSSSWPLLAEVKSARTGFLLQPESMEGDTILKTSLPRVSRGEFPAGRGYFIARGKATRVQLPFLGG